MGFDFISFALGFFVGALFLAVVAVFTTRVQTSRRNEEVRKRWVREFRSKGGDS